MSNFIKINKDIKAPNIPYTLIRVSTQADMLALADAEIGKSVVYVSADKIQYQLIASPSSNIANWSAIASYVDVGNDGTNDTVPNSAQMQSYVTQSLLNTPSLPFVHFATTANDILSGLLARDGYTPVANNFALVKNQTNNDNSVYRVTSGAWVRQYYNEITELWSDINIVTHTIYSQLNINGGIVNVLNGTVNKNLQYQFNIVNESAIFGSSIVYVMATTKIPPRDIFNGYVSRNIGNDTNFNGSASFPYATVTKDLSGASFPHIANIAPGVYTEIMSITAGQSNLSLIANDTLDAGKTQFSNQITLQTGNTRYKEKGITRSVGSATPIVIAANNLGRHTFENCIWTTSGNSLMSIDASVINWINLYNIDAGGPLLPSIPLPNFTTGFTFNIYNQTKYLPFSFVVGSTGANCTINIYNSLKGAVVIPNGFTGTINYFDGYSINEVITDQTRLNTILADTTLSGFYAVSFASPTGMTAGCIFNKISASGFTVNNITETFANGKTSSIYDLNTKKTFFKDGSGAFNGWSAAGSGSGSGGFSVIADTTTTTLNLNSLNTTGITNFSGVTSLINGPTGIVPIAGKLLTVENYVSTNGRVQNLLLNDNKYFRSYINSIWSSWQLIATVDTTPNSDIIDGLATPPASPSNGNAYIMLANPTGAWSTFAQGTIATYNESTASWVNTIPANGSAITFSNPVNLNSINSYYIAGQTYKYNSGWGSPVITGLLWQLYVASSQFQPYDSQAISLALASNVVTATCPQNHNLAVGYSLTISSSPNAAFNETVTVTAIISPTVFRYAKTLANTTTTGTLKATTQLLSSGCTSVLVPSTISFNVIIAVAAGSYSNGSSFICTNLRSAPCYVAGIPIGKLESIVLTTNATAQWQSADKKYTIEKITAHGFTNALYQNKVIVMPGNGDTVWSLADSSDLTKIINGKFVLNVIDADNILVANYGLVTTFIQHNFLPNTPYSYGNGITGGIGNLVDATTITTGNIASNTLIQYRNAYQFDWYPDKIFYPVITSLPVALQTEAYNKQFALIDGEKLNNVNNILSLTTSNTKIKISATNKTVYGKFSGQTKAIRSVDEDFNAALIPVFGLGGLANPTNCNPNLDPAIKNINSYGNGGSTINFILAINPAGTLFAIPAPTATPNSHFVDAIGNSAVMTAGQIGFELNPLKAYRHNGTAVELYDFILMGQVTWNGSAFSNVINYAFNGFVDSGWFSTTTNTQNIRNHNIGSSNINVIGYGSDSILGTNSGIVADYYAAVEARGTIIGGFTNTTLAIRIGGSTNQVFNNGTDVVLGSFFKFIATRNY